MNLTDLRRLNPVGDQIVRVRGPVRHLIGIVFLPILAELNLFLTLSSTDIDIVPMNVNAPLPVRRDIPFGLIPSIPISLTDGGTIVFGPPILGDLSRFFEFRQLMGFEFKLKMTALNTKEKA